MEKMTIQLIDIRQRPDTMSPDIALIPKRLQLPKHLDVSIQLDLGLAASPSAIIGGIHGIDSGRVDPMLDFDLARSVIDLVRDVCSLGADVADLTDEEDGGGVCAVNLEVGFWVWLCCV